MILHFIFCSQIDVYSICLHTIFLLFFQTFPKPWTPNAFATILMRVLKTAEYAYKTAIAESLMQLHSQESLYDSTGIMKTFVGILNSRTDAPSCAIENQKRFILYCLKALQHLGMKDRDYITELMLQYLDGDREVRYGVVRAGHAISSYSYHGIISSWHNQFMAKSLSLS